MSKITKFLKEHRLTILAVLPIIVAILQPWLPTLAESGFFVIEYIGGIAPIIIVVGLLLWERRKREQMELRSQRQYNEMDRRFRLMLKQESMHSHTITVLCCLQLGQKIGLTEKELGEFVQPLIEEQERLKREERMTQ